MTLEEVFKYGANQNIQKINKIELCLVWECFTILQICPWSGALGNKFATVTIEKIVYIYFGRNIYKFITKLAWEISPKKVLKNSDEICKYIFTGEDIL